MDSWPPLALVIERYRIASTGQSGSSQSSVQTFIDALRCVAQCCTAAAAAAALFTRTVWWHSSANLVLNSTREDMKE
jgi:hypothetical protein